MLLPLCESCVRWSVSNRVTPSDATLSHGGVTAAHVDPRLAEHVYRFSEQRGCRVKLGEAIGFGHSQLPAFEGLGRLVGLWVTR